MDLPGQRVADEPIYLREDRYDEPKELFKFIAGLIETGGRADAGALLDVGCATGELIHYLAARLPGIGRLEGLDVSEPMIEAARRAVSGATFRVGSILDPACFPARDHDVVVCSGVVSCFDDIETPLRHLLAATKQGGVLYVYTPINRHPIDVVMRYRRADHDNAEWETGWNIFSRVTFERTLGALGYRLDLVWHPFEMPFPIERRPDDPMRTWTIRTEDKPFQTVNGAAQMIDGQVLEARVSELPG